MLIVFFHPRELMKCFYFLRQAAALFKQLGEDPVALLKQLKQLLPSLERRSEARAFNLNFAAVFYENANRIQRYISRMA